MTGASQPSTSQWRREQRLRLIEQRKTLTADERHDLTSRVIANLDQAIREIPCATLGIYWPIKREIALLDWAGAISRKRNLALAMPVVTIPRSPLEYWIWRPGDAMTRGFWNIPVPAEKVPVDPDVVIAPLVGFSGCWRLGYGGGYFDRTLAARAPRPIALGVGFDFSDLPDFAPEPHDIPMETIVTGKRIKSRWQI